jgi:hypothetical protein
MILVGRAGIEITQAFISARLARRRLTPGGFMTCMEISMNGVRIGLIEHIILKVLQTRL